MVLKQRNKGQSFALHRPRSVALTLLVGTMYPPPDFSINEIQSFALKLDAVNMGKKSS